MPGEWHAWPPELTAALAMTGDKDSFVSEDSSLEPRQSGADGAAVDARATTSHRQFDSFVIQFDRPVDPAVSGGNFDFKALEECEGAGTQLGTVRYDYIDLPDVWLNGDGKDDLATYQPDKMPIHEDWTVIVITDHGVW